MPPISNDDPMYPGMAPDQIEKYKQQMEREAQNRAANQRRFQDVNSEWLSRADELRATTPTRGMEREGNARGYMGQLRGKADQAAAQLLGPNVPFDDAGGKYIGYGDYNRAAQAQQADQAQRAEFLRSLAGDTNYAQNARMSNFVEPPLKQLTGPQLLSPEEMQAQVWGKGRGKAITPAWRSQAQPLPGPTPEEMQMLKWAGAPDEAISRAWSPQKPNYMAAMTGQAAPQKQWAQHWDEVARQQGPMGGSITPAWRHQAYPGEPMGALTQAAPAAAAAAPAAGIAGRAAGAARGAMGLFGGLTGLGAWGVLNNAIDLSNPNSVLRKSIHEGDYGTALARGAVNFIPGGGTIWDNLTQNNHPEQPTVNQPKQETDVETPQDLTGLFTGDPLNHGNYTSRGEAQKNYQLAHQYADKPGVAAAKNQIAMMNRDLKLALQSGDKQRIQQAYSSLNKFEYLLALGQGSYPYNTGAIAPVEREWIGD